MTVEYKAGWVYEGHFDSPEWRYYPEATHRWMHYTVYIQHKFDDEYEVEIFRTPEDDLTVERYDTQGDIEEVKAHALACWRTL